jgi:hypothetical protein
MYVCIFLGYTILGLIPVSYLEKLKGAGTEILEKPEDSLRTIVPVVVV